MSAILVINHWSLVIAISSASAPSIELARRAESEFRKATASDNPAERTKAFAAAASYYKELRERGVQTAAMYLNLGKAQYLADELPGAIASFHQGLRQRPDDAELHECLEHARSRVEYPAGTRAPVRSWPAYLPSNLLLGLALAFHALGWLAWCRRSALELSATWIWSAFTLAGICAIAWGASQWRLHAESTRAFVVVARDDVPLRRGNGESYPAHADGSVLVRGVEAELLNRRGEWVQVRLASGQIGWVQKGQVLLE